MLTYRKYAPLRSSRKPRPDPSLRGGRLARESAGAAVAGGGSVCKDVDGQRPGISGPTLCPDCVSARAPPWPVPKKPGDELDRLDWDRPCLRLTVHHVSRLNGSMRPFSSRERINRETGRWGDFLGGEPITSTRQGSVESSSLAPGATFLLRSARTRNAFSPSLPPRLPVDSRSSRTEWPP
jgi:hypothetical protein